MAYTPDAIANYFLQLAENRSDALTPLKLQKLVYYAHGWCLAILGEPLVNEPVAVWKWGPVIRTLYERFKQFGDGPITGRAERVRLDLQDGKLAVIRSTPTLHSEAESMEKEFFAKELLNKVWEVYGTSLPAPPSAVARAPERPCLEVIEQYDRELPKATEIPQNTIRRYFLNQARK